MDTKNPYKGDISIFFTSKDKKITFFTFPIYGTNTPKRIAINPETEEYVANEQLAQNKIVIIKAKDNSYVREYMFDEFNIVGQQFDNPETKTAYSKAFEKFSKSVEVVAN